MFVGLPSTVDRLGLDGILDYDVEAYVKGAPPRFVGGQPNYMAFERPLYSYEPNLMLPPMLHGNARLVRQPHGDEFSKNPYGIKHSEEGSHQSPFKAPDWKRLLTYAVLGGVAIFGGYKTVKFFKNRQAAKAAKAAAAQNSPAPKWYKNPFKWIKSKFSSKNNPPKP